jgi:hypothetical protein
MLSFKNPLQNHWANLNRLGTNHPWGIQFCSNETDYPSAGRDNSTRIKIILGEREF